MENVAGVCGCDGVEFSPVGCSRETVVNSSGSLLTQQGGSVTDTKTEKNEL